jgi:hypothetical protein
MTSSAAGGDDATGATVTLGVASAAAHPAASAADATTPITARDLTL